MVFWWTCVSEPACSVAWALTPKRDVGGMLRCGLIAGCDSCGLKEGRKGGKCESVVRKSC